jgi:hypothetical protein
MARQLWKVGSAGPHIARALETTIFALLTARVFLEYTSRNFMKGIDVAVLERASDGLLQPLLRLDGRGGFFSQNDIEYGLNGAVKANEQCQILVEQHATEMGCPSAAAFITMAAYLTRVMMNHLRIKRRAYMKLEMDQRTASRTHPSSLVAAYDLFTGAKDTGKKRKCPFIHFRHDESTSEEGEHDEEESDEEKEPDGDVKTVLKYLDGESKRGMRLLSNGKQEPATEHVAGENGFIVARWAAPAEEFELDLPNACLKSHGGIIAAAPLPAHATHPGRKDDEKEAEAAVGNPKAKAKGKGKAKVQKKPARENTSVQPEAEASDDDTPEPKAKAKGKGKEVKRKPASESMSVAASENTSVDGCPLQPGIMAVISGLVSQSDYNDHACVVVDKVEDSDRWRVKCLMDGCPVVNVKRVNLIVITAKEAAKYVCVHVGDLTIKGTPQGVTDPTRDPLFLVDHDGSHIGSIGSSRKQRRSFFEAFEIVLKVCHDLQGTDISKDAFGEARDKYM